MHPDTKRIFHKLHRWGGLILAALVFFYCVTGILLNHRAAFDHFIVKERTVAAVPASDTAVLEAFLAFYKRQIGREDDPTVIRINKERTIEFLYGAHGQTTYVIDPRAGTMEKVEKRPQQPFSFLNDLHKAAKTSDLWLLLADFTGAVVITITVTGLLVVRYRPLDYLLAAGGVLLLVAGMWLA
ncbi:MAG: PepSY-associated TM helix domain-containing protein [Desulfobulbaceae bacterium]|nr:PepSY-associated TM helix domain-containing protein [Desulfobulbaceae bacterium]